MTSPDFRVARALGTSIAVLMLGGVVWRSSMHSLDVVDVFFLAVVALLAVFVVVMSSSRVTVSSAEDVIVVRNGWKSHNIAVNTIITIDVVNPGDRALSIEANRRKTQLVRFGLLDRPSVVAVALLREPALRARSAGAAGLEPVVATLRSLAGLGNPAKAGEDDVGPDRRMPE